MIPAFDCAHDLKAQAPKGSVGRNLGASKGKWRQAVLAHWLESIVLTVQAPRRLVMGS